MPVVLHDALRSLGVDTIAVALRSTLQDVRRSVADMVNGSNMDLLLSGGKSRASFSISDWMSIADLVLRAGVFTDTDVSMLVELPTNTEF